MGDRPAPRTQPSGADSGRPIQPRLRCAVYTRKSSEEGLDQEFNSLDAQREACAAYIVSQAGLGWKRLPTLYDDGGISGGTMERPALQRLLQDIRDRRIDVVVVYKIDRLTRSLMDFSRIVEIFDASSVSFVSVTQAFNTTSSMGRLTLNVLLSFAQFEREVTAERIRDKIAASRKKGMWMGGRVPFGYEVKNRKLIINEKQADMVRYLFRRYLELKSVLALADEFNRMRCGEDCAAVGVGESASVGVADTVASEVTAAADTATSVAAATDATAATVSTDVDGGIAGTGDIGYIDTGESENPERRRAGTCNGGATERDDRKSERNSSGGKTPSPIAWSRGKLYYLLSNQLYIGRIKHHDQHFDGEHEAIIDADQFAKVQALLGKQSPRRKGTGSNETGKHLVSGIAFDETGDRLSPAYANNHGKRYRYYVSARLKTSQGKKDGGWRIPAHELEAAVTHLFTELFTDQARLSDWVRQYASTDHIIAALKAAEFYAARTSESEHSKLLRPVIQRITLFDNKISVQIDRRALVTILCKNEPGGENPHSRNDDGQSDFPETPFIIDLPITIRRRGFEQRIIVQNHVQARLPDAKLVDLIARANLYLARLTDGDGLSIADVATQCGVHRADISRVLPLAFLSPRIVEAILTGHQPSDLTVKRLARSIDLPLAWCDQETAFGL